MGIEFKIKQMNGGGGEKNKNSPRRFTEYQNVLISYMLGISQNKYSNFENKYVPGIFNLTESNYMYM